MSTTNSNFKGRRLNANSPVIDLWWVKGFKQSSWWIIKMFLCSKDIFCSTTPKTISFQSIDFVVGAQKKLETRITIQNKRCLKKKLLGQIYKIIHVIQDSSTIFHDSEYKYSRDMSLGILAHRNWEWFHGTILTFSFRRWLGPPLAHHLTFIEPGSLGSWKIDLLGCPRKLVSMVRKLVITYLQMRYSLGWNHPLNC